MADDTVLAKIRAAEKKADEISAAAKKQAEDIIIDAKRTSVKLLEESELKIKEVQEARIKDESAKIQKKKSELIDDAAKHAGAIRGGAEKNIPKAETYLYKKFLGTLEG